MQMFILFLNHADNFILFCFLKFKTKQEVSKDKLKINNLNTLSTLFAWTLFFPWGAWATLEEQIA